MGPYLLNEIKAWMEKKDREIMVGDELLLLSILSMDIEEAYSKAKLGRSLASTRAKRSSFNLVLGIIMLQAEKLDEAGFFLIDALSCDSIIFENFRKEVLYWLAYEKTKKSLFCEAKDLCNDGIEEDVNDPRFYSLRATAHFYLEEYDLADQDLIRASILKKRASIPSEVKTAT